MLSSVSSYISLSLLSFCRSKLYFSLFFFFIERQYFIMFGRLDKNILQLQPKWRWMLSGRLQLSRNLCHIPHCCHMQCQICVRCECGVLRNIFAWRVFICNTHNTHTVLTLTLKHTHSTHFSSVRFGSVSFLFYLCGRPSYFMLLYIEHILMLHNMLGCGVGAEVGETAAG